MVGLVLQGAGQEAAAGDGEWFAVLVDAAGGGVQGAGGREVQAGDGQAALVVVLEFVGQFEGGVDQVAAVSVGVVDEHLGVDADLRGGDAGAAGGAQQGVHEVGDQGPQFGVEAGDGVAVVRSTGSPMIRIGRIVMVDKVSGALLLPSASAVAGRRGVVRPWRRPRRLRRAGRCAR